MRITVRQAQFRWFAIRQLVTSALFGASFLGLAVLILVIEYRFMLVSICLGFGACVVGWYGLRMLRVAMTAKDTSVDFSPQSMTRTVDGVATVDRINCVAVYPDQLAASVAGTGPVDFPIGKAQVAAALVSLRREGIPFVEMSGVGEVVLRLLAMGSFLVVGFFLTRVLTRGVVFGVLGLVAWSPAVAAVLLTSLVVVGVGILAWRRRAR